MRRVVLFSGWIFAALVLALLGERCGSPSSSSSPGTEETIIAWTVERPRYGEYLKVKEIDVPDPGDCADARYRVTLER